MSEVCQDCGSPYDEIYRVPDDVWRKISPKTDQGDGLGGLLCMHCAEVRAWRMGITLYWEAGTGAFPGGPGQDAISQEPRSLAWAADCAEDGAA